MSMAEQEKPETGDHDEGIQEGQPTDFAVMQALLLEALDELQNDPNVHKQAEEFRRKAMDIPADVWLRPFDI